MKIAVTYENGEIFQHFGHSEQFKIYDAVNSTIVASKMMSTMGNGHGALVELLKDQNVDTLICGGIGGGAMNALVEAEIKVYGGAVGDADTAVKNLLENKLNYNPDVKCEHHNHEDNSCGEHNCSNH